MFSFTEKESRALSDIIHAAMDQFGRPVFLFDKDLKLEYTNLEASKISETSEARSNQMLAKIQSAAAEIIKSRTQSTDNLAHLKHARLYVGSRAYVLEVYPVQVSDSREFWAVMMIDMTGQFDIVSRFAAENYRLSQRETEIIAMLMKGLSNREIAEQIFISELTVKDHVKSILDKMKVTSRNQLMAKLLL